MEVLQRGSYLARLARTPGDIAAALELRGRCFRVSGAGSDADGFDSACAHMLVEDQADGALVACYRLIQLPDGARIDHCYSAQYYDLSSLRTFPGPILEMGRFCIDPDRADPDVLRLAWAAMTRFVDDNGIELLIGCASFRGTEPEGYSDAFALLRDRHLAPARWLPRVKAPAVFRYAQKLRRTPPDIARAMRAMPPLLRSYLGMGGWVSDHAVVDRDLGTLHVFTGVEVAAIPPARARLLRAGAAAPRPA